MYTSHEISWQEHNDWFNSVQTDSTRLYFIYSDGGDDHGVVYFTDYKPQQAIAFWGFYASDKAPGGTGILMEYDALGYAFETLKLHKLNCEVISYNKAVINLHKKAGFIEEGLFRDYHYFEGRYFDVVRLGMLDSEWEQARDYLQKRIAQLKKQK